MRNRNADRDFGLDRARARIENWQWNFRNFFLGTVDSQFYIDAKTEPRRAHTVRTTEGAVFRFGAHLLGDACVANVGKTNFVKHESDWVLGERKSDRSGVLHCGYD